MKKIKNKITLPIIVSFIILMLIIDIIIVFIFNTQIKTKFINSVSLEQKLESYGIDSNTSEIESKTESIEDYVKSTFNFERLTEEKDEYLTEYENFLEPVIKNVAETTENNDSVYIHFLPELTGNTHDIYYKKAGNEYIRQPELEKEEYDINRSDMTWYFDPIIKGSSVWTGPYQWKGEYYISYTKPVFDDGKIIAVVGMDYLKNVMDELLSGKQEYEKENKILINGTKIIYSLAEVSNEYIDEIINLSIKKVDFAQIKNKYIFISKLHNGWDYVNIIDRSEILSSLYYTLAYIALIALIIILIIVIFITEKISIILKPLDIITEKVKKINSENYSESLLIKTDDEIEIVSEALDKMKENLLFSMKTINEKNENINLRNEELTASNEELEAQNNELENLYEEIFKLSNNLKNILNLMSNYDNKKFEIDDFFREIIYNIFNIIPESDEIILYNLYENKVLIPYMTYGTELKNISEITVKNIFSENRQIYIFKAPSEITDDKKFIKKYENTKNIFMCLINTTGRNMVMFMTLREEDEDYYNENIKDTLNAFIILTKSFITNKNKYDELKEAYILFSSKLAYIVEFHDEITGKHINRVGIISALLAEKMNMKKDFVEDIKIYAPLHDIGKIFISEEILNKKGNLNKDEWEIMKTHTLKAKEILDERNFKMALSIALYHHEKYDGTGYPYGIKKDEIPMEAQIVSIVDVYDALRSKRSYKDKMSHEKAVEIIINGDGRTNPCNFNPEIIRVFIENSSEIKNIFDNMV